MSGWWTPIWSFGTGAHRIYCGIAQTEEGFAVDVFQGDTCIESLVYATRPEALTGAAAFEREFARRARPTLPVSVRETDTLAAHG